MGSLSRRAALLLSALFGLASCGGELDLQPLAVGQTERPPRPQPDPQVQYAPVATTAPSPAIEEPLPPEDQWVYSSPQGRWVYTMGSGWIWVPADAVTSTVAGVPYAYLYERTRGWNWYVSPWGAGPYHYGVWVRHVGRR
jgi:hypothetical protein